MARSKKKAQNGGQQKGRTRGPKRPNGGGRALSDYAHLLACPDSGPLVHPLYGGTTEGYLIRVRKVINASAYEGTAPGTTVNLSCVWTPGDATRPINVFRTSSSIPADSVGFQLSNPMLDTGFPINAARCVAAQLEAKYTGREIDRSGLGSCGQLVVTNLPSVGPTNQGGQGEVNGWTDGPPGIGTRPPGAVVAEHVTDHPNHLVVKWRPTSVDEMWTQVASGSTLEQGTNRIQNPSLYTTVEGASADVVTPYTFILTAVYEWKPRQASGLANTPTAYAAVKATAAQAVQAATRMGVKWAGSLMQDAASTLPAMMMAYAGRRAYGPPRLEL